MNRILTLAITALAAGGSLPAAAFTVDGKLDDWIANPTTWVALPGKNIHSSIEDQVGPDGRVYPGWGAQAYDAEALYAAMSGDRLYVALATGHNPRTLNQGNSYGAGDFAIDFGKDGTYELGINILHAESLKKGVYTFEKFGVEGGVYRRPTWAYGLWNVAGNLAKGDPDLSHPTHLTAGELVGMADIRYTTTPAKGYGDHPADDHYFYEMSLPVSLLIDSGWDGTAFNIHWTENCANDSILVDPPADIPEPATLALIGLGLFGLVRRRTKKKAVEN